MIGVRNPQGMAIDNMKNLYISNHGAKGGDFVGFIESGGNYGWNEIGWGFNIGGIFAVDRVFMTRLSPEIHLGEFYGLYSTVGRFATILGPILWGLIVNTLNLSRNVAMGSLIVLLAVSFYIIKDVSDKERY